MTRFPGESGKISRFGYTIDLGKNRRLTMGREPWTSRLTVQECPIHLSAVEFRDAGIFKAAAGTSFTISWPLSDGSSLGSLRVEKRSDWRGPHLFVGADWRGPRLLMEDDQMIRLTTTRPHWGGERFLVSL
jgi:hypothetical protein